MPNTLQETLINAGLDQSMADIYLLLAQHGELSVGSIIEKSSLSRAGAYDALTYLYGEGLVDYRKEGRNAYYKLAHPDKLRDLLSERKREVKSLEDELGNTIKTVTGMYNLSQHKPGVRFLEGPDGIREVTFDSLRSSGMIYTIIDMDATIAHAKEMNDEYVKERIKRNIHKKQIVVDSPAARERYKVQPTDRLLEVRFISAQKNPFQTGIQMYDNTISYSTLTEKAQIGVIIEDEHIARTNKVLFEYIWNTLTPPSSAPAAPPRPAAGAYDSTAGRSRDNLQSSQ